MLSCLRVNIEEQKIIFFMMTNEIIKKEKRKNPEDRGRAQRDGALEGWKRASGSGGVVEAHNENNSS